VGSGDLPNGRPSAPLPTPSGALAPQPLAAGTEPAVGSPTGPAGNSQTDGNQGGKNRGKRGRGGLGAGPAEPPPSGNTNGGRTGVTVTGRAGTLGSDDF
jgi:hypothetical protein